jgi:DNA polymerase-3 subunit epsilon
MVREIVFDTETTGLSPNTGDRLLEIGAIELINHMPTGRHYHQFINPQRDVPEDAYKVHGLSREFLKDFPVFEEIADDFLEFIGDATLVAHNAQFDMSFINWELKNARRKILSENKVVDTLDIAKRVHPGAKNNLDALCRRYNIDNSDRTKHGALIDSELLAKVYLELLGGQAPKMVFEKKEEAVGTIQGGDNKAFRESRKFTVSEIELKEHEEFLKDKLKEAVWSQ